ncbi:MAG: tyrosine-type recombinase/integrase [Planctomycetota bacterium]
MQEYRRTGRVAGVPWLFPSPEGKRWDPDNLSRHFRGVMQRARLSWNLLELRHTFGSQLASKGVSLLKIARLMGNSPAIASKHYINLVPEEMASDVEF